MRLVLNECFTMSLYMGQACRGHRLFNFQFLEKIEANDISTLDNKTKHCLAMISYWLNEHFTAKNVLKFEVIFNMSGVN